MYYVCIKKGTANSASQLCRERGGQALEYGMAEAAALEVGMAKPAALVGIRGGGVLESVAALKVGIGLGGLRLRLRSDFGSTSVSCSS